MGLSLGLGLDLGRRGGRTGGGAAPWLPSSLTGYVGSPFSVAYFRSLGTLWQNTVKTIPAVADGDPVRVASCDGVDWIAPTDAARPLLWDEGGGLWSLYYDGVDDELRATATVGPNFTAGISALHTSPGTNALYWTFGGETNDWGFFAQTGANVRAFRNGIQASANATPTVAADELAVLTVRGDGNSGWAGAWAGLIGKGGPASVAATLGYAEGDSPVVLGSRDVGSVRIRGFVLCDSTLSDPDQQQMVDYLSTL
jgi:hypothetical protein